MERIKHISGIRSRDFLFDYLKYSLGYFPGLIEGIIALYLFANVLNSEDFSEWAIIEAILVVLISWAQLGTKFGYMQAVAKLNNSVRDGLLRYVLKFNAISSLFFGLIFCCIATLFSWKNQALIYWFPVIALSSNLLVIIQTDFRIAQQPEGYLKLIFCKVIIYIALLGLINKWHDLQLIHHYVLMCVAQLIIFGWWLRSKALIPILVTREQKKYIFSAVGGSWLGPFKYFADFLVPILILEKLGLDWSSELGKVSRVLGSLEAIFLTPFLLVWGSRVYFWLGQTNSGNRLRTEILTLYKITPLVLCVMALLAVLIVLLIDLELKWTLALPLMVMMLSRKIFFAAYFPSSYGIVHRQRYFLGSLLLVLEFACTAAIFLLPDQSVWILTGLAALPVVIAGAHFYLSNLLIQNE